MAQRTERRLAEAWGFFSIEIFLRAKSGILLPNVGSYFENEVGTQPYFAFRSPIKQAVGSLILSLCVSPAWNPLLRQLWRCSPHPQLVLPGESQALLAPFFPPPAFATTPYGLSHMVSVMCVCL